ncbi:hypothetical protein C8U37_107131 [Trichococcus patagoniensis]|uniref:Uncharacterized protein n=1 Tax=Trichococcus patagoniensis TaxID=382641 RepID=A0A2T5ILR8_9LACT|nr:hypothetical protein [Trichococcus patagoniensis]PTQ84763.1 hypothetical protein C8U37_107131 [Trichococcus patagoniensis]
MTKQTPKQDLNDWLVDNFFVIDSHINKICKVKLSKLGIDEEDVDSISEEISGMLKTGLLNIVGTYEEVDG